MELKFVEMVQNREYAVTTVNGKKVFKVKRVAKNGKWAAFDLSEGRLFPPEQYRITIFEKLAELQKQK